MKMSVHLNFAGDCAAAFGLYKSVFGAERAFSMKYSEAPDNRSVPAEWKDRIMHASVPLGGGLLMGCDVPPGSGKPLSGFQVSVEVAEEAEAKRIFTALKESGSVQMELAPTFWSPLFGMCTDKFGVGWMVSLPGSEHA